MSEVPAAPSEGAAVVEFDCPNCCRRHGAVNACLMALIATVVSDRGTVSEEAIARACESADPDVLWERWGGPAADWLEDKAQEVSSGVAE